MGYPQAGYFGDIGRVPPNAQVRQDFAYGASERDELGGIAKRVGRSLKKAAKTTKHNVRQAKRFSSLSKLALPAIAAGLAPVTGGASVAALATANKLANVKKVQAAIKTARKVQKKVKQGEAANKKITTALAPLSRPKMLTAPVENPPAPDMDDSSSVADKITAVATVAAKRADSLAVRAKKQSTKLAKKARDSKALSARIADAARKLAAAGDAVGAHKLAMQANRVAAAADTAQLQADNIAQGIEVAGSAVQGAIDGAITGGAAGATMESAKQSVGEFVKNNPAVVAGGALVGVLILSKMGGQRRWE